jgi:hypothetical protein
MRKLFLDDVRTPPDSTWDVVRSFDAFVNYVSEHGVPDVVSFDHDLADAHYAALTDEAIAAATFTEKTGYDAAKWLADRGDFPKRVIVHSWNPAGARRIARLFDRCEITPYRA